MDERQLAVVVADLAGFSALTEAHGDHDALGAVEEATGIIHEVTASHGITLVKSLGDGFLMFSEDPHSAMAGAVEAVERVCEKPRLPVMRAGIDAGAVICKDGDIFGGVVNRAARVCAEAAPDQVAVTRAVLDLAPPPGDVVAVSLGRRRLRNISTAVEIFALQKECASGHVVDPVCRMSLPLETVHSSVTISTDTYHFCSAGCLERFEADPSLFTEANRSATRHAKETDRA